MVVYMMGERREGQWKVLDEKSMEEIGGGEEGGFGVYLRQLMVLDGWVGVIIRGWDMGQLWEWEGEWDGMV